MFKKLRPFDGFFERSIKDLHIVAEGLKMLITSHKQHRRKFEL